MEVPKQNYSVAVVRGNTHNHPIWLRAQRAGAVLSWVPRLASGT